ncbi:TPA: hypothetical protein ACNVLA_004914 [Klebsiella aerogenes]
MEKVRIGIFLGLLAMQPLAVSAELSLEETARQVMIGFENEDAELINSFIDKDMGLYVLFRRGASANYERLMQINFNQPVPEYLSWPTGGNHIPSNKEFERRIIPLFECEEGWDREGYFISGYDSNHKLSATMVWTKLNDNSVSDADISAARKLEFDSVRVVAVPYKSSTGLVFYLSQLHEQNNWSLTVVDQVIDCGA